MGSRSKTTAAGLIPDRPTLPKVRAAAKDCKACDLWRLGTQTVFGEGSRTARVMLVGEQPGDQEDLAGRPFVGPAGRELDKALAEAGFERSEIYVTNVVKHFKWEPRGKRRIHKKPNATEMSACRPWLETEIALVKPRALVCLGATAAQALLGREFKVSERRGERVDSPLAPVVSATVHPSSILRAPDDKSRQEERRRFVQDLRRIRGYLSRT
jgi:uracil-DNA glycosylase family protein